MKLKSEFIINHLNKLNIHCVLYFCIFLLYCILCFLFPYSGDDWCWGGPEGIERMNHLFRDYNGRYIGNLTVILLTRSRILRTFVMAFSHTFIIYVINKLSLFSKAGAVFILGLMLCMPQPLFTEAVVWTSGFSNYVLSAVTTMTYIYFMNEMFRDKAPSYRRYSSILFLLLGFVGNLFVEHMTLYNLFLGGFSLIYVYIRFRKICRQFLAFTVGSIAGAILMFSNSSYRNITEGTDFYRTVPNSFGTLVRKLLSNTFYHGVPDNFYSNVILLPFLCITLLFVSSAYRSQLVGIRKMVNNVSKTYIASYTVLAVIDSFYGRIFYNACSITVMLLSLLMAVALPAALWSLPLDRREKEKLFFMQFSPYLITFILLFVDPIGPRCFYIVYVFYAALAMMLLNYAVRKNGPIKDYGKYAALCVSGVYVFYYLFIYGSIFVCDQRRQEKAHADIESGMRKIVVEDLVFDSYVWFGNPSYGWEKGYKAFYGMDDDVEIINTSSTFYPTVSQRFLKQ